MSQQPGVWPVVCLSVGLVMGWGVGQGCSPGKKQGSEGALTNTCVSDADCDPSGETCSAAGFCQSGGGRANGSTCTRNTACASGICIPRSASAQICRAAASILGGACNDDSDCVAGSLCNLNTGTGLGACGGVGASCASNAACSIGNYCIPTSAVTQMCRVGQSPRGAECNEDADCGDGVKCTVTAGTGQGICGGTGARCANNAGCSIGNYCIPINRTTQQCQLGQSALAGSCNDHQDCLGGMLCSVVDGSGAGSCGPVGTVCPSNQNCAAGTFCIPTGSGTVRACLYPSDPGGLCDDDADCGAQAFCSTGVCGGDGALCNNNNGCSNSFPACVPNGEATRCRIYRVKGFTCNDNEDCNSVTTDVFCGVTDGSLPGGTCGGVNAFCANNDKCSSAYPACVPDAGSTSCQAPRSRGATCNGNDDCVPGINCSATAGDGTCGGVGAVCNTNAQCDAQGQVYCIPNTANSTQTCRLHSAAGGACNEQEDCEESTSCSVNDGTSIGICGELGTDCSTDQNCKPGVKCGSNKCGGTGAVCMTHANCHQIGASRYCVSNADGTKRCLETPSNCLDIKSIKPFALTGEYDIDVDGTGVLAAFPAYCDMDTDEGGWTLVLNYLHKGGTNPSLRVLDGRLPRKGSDSLGTDESTNHIFFGHSATSLLAKISFTEVRFYGITNPSNHSRAIHFKTSLCVDYFKGGQGSCAPLGLQNPSGWQQLPVPSAFSTAQLPSQASNHCKDQGDFALTECPFYGPSAAPAYYWNLKGGDRDERWEVDDAHRGYNVDTLHRIFVR